MKENEEEKHEGKLFDKIVILMVANFFYNFDWKNRILRNRLRRRRQARVLVNSSMQAAAKNPPQVRVAV